MNKVILTGKISREGRKVYISDVVIELQEVVGSKGTGEELYQESDSIKAFIDECVVRTIPETLIKRDVLYGRYRRYCEEHGLEEYSARIFYKMLGELGYRHKRRNDGRYFAGITVRKGV